MEKRGMPVGYTKVYDFGGLTLIPFTFARWKTTQDHITEVVLI